MKKKYIAIGGILAVAIIGVGAFSTISTNKKLQAEELAKIEAQKEQQAQETVEEEPIKEVIIDKDVSGIKPNNDVTNEEVPEEVTLIGTDDQVEEQYSVDKEDVHTAEEESEALSEELAPEPIPEGEVVIDVLPDTSEPEQPEVTTPPITDTNDNTSTDNGGNTDSGDGGNYASGSYADNPALNPTEEQASLGDFDLEESEAEWGEMGTGDKF